MNKRIIKIASYVEPYDKVIDVGCDMALLGEYLAKKNIFSVSSDIRRNIIENASKRIEKLELNKYIKFIVTDGLDNTESEEFDTVVLSGMGTYTILKILERSIKKYKKIIIISNNNHDILRVKMLELGYCIKEEEIIFDKNKFYNLILFIPGKSVYTTEEIIIGKNHKNIELLNKKLLIDLKKYKKIYKKNKDNYIKENINIIEKRLGSH